MEKWKLTAFLALASILFLLIAAGCSNDDGDNKEQEEQMTVPQAPPTVDGIGELTRGEDIPTTVIPANATVNTREVQEFLDLYRATIGMGGMRLSAGTSGRAARSAAQRTYVVRGDIYGGVRVTHEKAGIINTGNYEFESIGNEFFDFSNADGLYLGGSVGYLITQTKNASSVTTTQRVNGTVRFNGAFRGEIAFNNLVVENGRLISGTFRLISGGATVDLPVDLLEDFIFWEEFETTPNIPQPTFVPVTRINADIPTTVRAGSTLALLASVSPMEATNRRITWTVDGGASISAQGVITFGQVPPSNGIVRITATIPNGRAESGSSEAANYTQNWPVRVVAANEFVPVETIRFPIPDIVGQNHTLVFSLDPARVLPENATNRQITWTAEGATLQTTAGVVTGILFDTLGRATITATIANGAAQGRDYVHPSWDILVEERITPVTNINANIPSEASVGSVSTANVSVISAAATNQEIVWTISPADIGTIINTQGTAGGNAGIVIQWHSAGTARITATIVNGTAQGRNYTQTWSATVVAGDTLPTFVPVREIRADIPQTITSTGGRIDLSTATVLPENATNQNIVWTVPTGITGVRIVGEAIVFEPPLLINTNIAITAMIANGTTATGTPTDGISGNYIQTWSITIVDGGDPDFIPVEDIIINHPAEVQQGTSSTFIVRVIPENATNAHLLTVSVEPETVGRLVQGGSANIITWLAAGTATITASIGDETGGMTAFLPVRVLPSGGDDDSTFVPVESIDAGRFIPQTIQPGSHRIVVRSSEVLPANATNKNIVWSVLDMNNNPLVGAQVENNETVVLPATVAVPNLSFMIVATIANGRAETGANTDFTQTWTVRVVGGGTDPRPSITADIPSTITLTTPRTTGNYPFQVVLPAGATYIGIEWMSSDPSIAAIVSNPAGIPGATGNAVSISWLSAGDVTITATVIYQTTADGEMVDNAITESWNVTVRDAGSGTGFVPVTGIRLATTAMPFPTQAQMGTSTTAILVNIEPRGAATIGDIRWTVNPQNAAVIQPAADGSNLITVNWQTMPNAGPVTITATIPNGTWSDDGNSRVDYTQDWVVNLTLPGGGQPNVVPVDTILFQGFPTTAQLNQSFHLGNAQVFPQSANRQISWSANNATINQVAGSNNPTVVFDRLGTAVITATIAGGALSGGVAIDYVQSWTVTVVSGGDGGDDPTDPTIDVDFPGGVVTGTPTTHTFQVIPGNATNLQVLWEISSPHSITSTPITSNGMGTLTIDWRNLPAGTTMETATITAMITGISEDGNAVNYTQSWEVPVRYNPWL
ncbi:MAG: hypothetical protein FWE23_06365 [Chitinivibrionia bacterium]|nr:hypothetical protein [Chitinivibrionia bacterium]